MRRQEMQFEQNVLFLSSSFCDEGLMAGMEM